MSALLTPDERLMWAYSFVKFDEKPIFLDFWQDAFLKSNSRFTAINKSRRVGFSFVASLKHFIKSQDPARTNYTCQFVSYNESDSEEKINYVRQFYEATNPGARKKLIACNTREIKFLDANEKTTSRLISMPCRPPRGKGGDIILDEYGIYLPKMSAAVYTAALPVISRGGCISIGSSPLGKIGRFYEVITDRKTYESYQVYNIPWWFCRDLARDVHEALKAGIAEYSTRERVERFGTDILQAIYVSMPEEDFQQEYECLFVDNSESYISLDLIYANTPGQDECDYLVDLAENEEVKDTEYWNYGIGSDIKAFENEDDLILAYNPELHGGPLFMGYDVAKKRDAVAFYIIGRFKGKKRSVARIVRRGITFQEQKDICSKLMHKLPIQRCCMDSTGMGAPLYEELHHKFGDKIEGVDFTMVSKEEMAIAIKHGLEQRQFMLENNKDFHKVIHSIRREPGAGGHFKYDSPRDEKGHADEFWAWALADRAERVASKNINDFYSEYARKKQQNAVLLSNVVQSTDENEIPRGKSLNSVMRSLRRGTIYPS